jgi:hypothetical protein
LERRGRKGGEGRRGEERKEEKKMLNRLIYLTTVMQAKTQ